MRPNGAPRAAAASIFVAGVLQHPFGPPVDGTVTRWFVGLGVDDRVWVPTVFTKNRERLLSGLGIDEELCGEGRSALFATDK
jgi:hypothetical protein